MWLLNMNYAKLVNKVLDIAIHQKGVNTAFDQNVYQLNSIDVQYPVFNVSPTEPQIERDSYMEFVLTLYYIDREQYSNNEAHNPDTTIIHSNGISILSNIIKKLNEDMDILEIDDYINYVCWSDTEIFADRCNGVYCTIHVKVPKDTRCAVE